MEKKLTYKQAAFCREYVSNKGDATAAYKAVYDWRGSDQGARQEAYRLMQDDAIKAEIEALTAPALKKCESTTEDRVKFLLGVLDDPTEKTENQLRAIDILNRMYGIYIQRTENTTENTVKLDREALDSLLNP